MANLTFHHEIFEKIKEAGIEDPVIIVGIDPGVTTGLAAIAFERGDIPAPSASNRGEILHAADQISYGGSGNARDLIDNLEGHFVEQAICHDIGSAVAFLNSISDYVFVAIEDFVIRRVDSSRDFLSPVRITAGILQFLYEGYIHPDNVVFQSPSDAKGVCTDERLDKWGFPIKNQKERHGRDATRHAILFLRKFYEKPQLRLLLR